MHVNVLPPRYDVVATYILRCIYSSLPPSFERAAIRLSYNPLLARSTIRDYNVNGLL